LFIHLSARIVVSLLLGASLLIFSGCSSWRGLVFNSSQTQVQLQKNNFKVIGRVTGEASAVYVFSVLGPDQQNLVSQAYLDMEKKANLDGGAKAIMNVVVDEKILLSLFHHKLTVYVSGTVVEFIQ
jgi:hypothetical protein